MNHNSKYESNPNIKNYKSLPRYHNVDFTYKQPPCYKRGYNDNISLKHSPCYEIIAKGYERITLGGQLQHQASLDTRICEKSPNSERRAKGFEIETRGDLYGERTNR